MERNTSIFRNGGEDQEMTTYQKNKARARHTAQAWQAATAENALSYGEIAESNAYFTKIGKRYGLINEFKENGII